MNKGDLVNQIAENVGISKNQATEALSTVLDGIAGTLAKGDKATLVGFGTFSVSERSARTGRNPQTGEEIQIPAKKVVKFKAGKELSSKV